MVLVGLLYITISIIIVNPKPEFYFTMFLYWTNKHKYYKLFEQKTLFGTIDVICIWGRIGGNLGNYKIITCENEEEVAKTIEQVKKKRVNKAHTRPVEGYD